MRLLKLEFFLSVFFTHFRCSKEVKVSESLVFFWADGDAHQFSKSELYFGNLKGEIWKLPYYMEKEFELTQQIK